MIECPVVGRTVSHAIHHMQAFQCDPTYHPRLLVLGFTSPRTSNIRHFHCRNIVFCSIPGHVDTQEICMYQQKYHGLPKVLIVNFLLHRLPSHLAL
jgi:hypothetical protein